jgi:hypothetical protein
MFTADRAFDIMQAVADISYGDAHGPNPQGECFDADNPDVNIESILYGVKNFTVGGFRILLPIKFTGEGQGRLNFHLTYAYTTDNQYILNTAKVQFTQIFINVTGPPKANAGPDQIVEQSSAAGTEVWLDGSASGGSNIIHEWREGTVLLGLLDRISVTVPRGTHHFTLKVTETGGYGESDTDEVVIIVCDTTPPDITPPADVTVEQTNIDGTPVDLGTPTVSDICDADPDITNDAPVVFPLGETVVTWKAEDDSGNVATATQTVTIVDTTPPPTPKVPGVTLWGGLAMVSVISLLIIYMVRRRQTAS